MNDPYKTLGVSRTATDEEIKKAYRDLARKYHPDNYVDNPLSDLVQEKMKEVNEAYDTIQRERSTKGSSSGSTGSYSTSGGSYSAELRHARELVTNGRYSEADIELGSIPGQGRNAEWNYLMGIVKSHRGYYYDAMRFFETACYLDPDNREYQAALSNIRSQSNGYGQTYRTHQNTSASGDCTACDICSGLMCADCCCECMGGDLISCC